MATAHRPDEAAGQPAPLTLPGPVGWQSVGNALICFLVVFLVAASIGKSIFLPSPPWGAIAVAILLLWVAGVWIRYGIRDEGNARRWLMGLLGMLSFRHFVEVDAVGPRAGTVCFCFMLCGRRFCRLQMSPGAIRYVNWRPGQATGRAGRDKQDWRIYVEYRLGDSPVDDAAPRPRRLQCLAVGRIGPQRRIEPVGHALVAFLQAAGAPLQATADPNRYLQPRDAKNQIGPHTVSLP